MITLSAIQCNPLIKEVYRFHKELGRHSLAAMGICMHKILRILYGMLKHNKPFDPNIDIENRQKIYQTNNEMESKNTTRRFQDYDPKAPVSRRQQKRRKERELSYRTIGSKSRIKTPVPLCDIITSILRNL